MVSAYALFTHPFPTPFFFDSPFPYPLPPTAHISHSSLSTFHNHQWSPLPTLAKTPRPEPNPLLTHLGFRPNPQFLLQCSSSPITADIGTVFSLLQAVGIDEKEAKVLLNKSPVLSFTSLDRLRGKIEPGQLRKLFRAADVRFLVGFDEKVGLLLRRGVSDEKIVDVLNKVNLYKALCLKSVEDIDTTITFLNRFGGIDLIVRRPSLLNYDLETQLAPRVEFLTEVSGGDENATGVLLGKLPAILSYTVDHTKGHVELLRSFAGLSDEQIFKILLVFPNVVSASRERKMRPRIKFLKECGLSSNDIYKFLIKAPLFLGLSFEDNLAYKLVFLVKIGYRYRTRDMAAAIGSATRTSSDNLQRVIELFLSYGFSCADIVVMSRRHPQILQYSHGALEKKMEYLINEMGREIGELLAFPAFLGYKLDDRIKARYEVKRKILGEGMSLNKLLTVSSESFTPKTPTYVIDLNVE